MAETEENVEETHKLDILDLTREDYDSDEEFFFAEYLKELIEAGIVVEARFNKLSIELSDPVKHRYSEIMKTKEKDKTQHLFAEHVYTPDFDIHFNAEYENVFYSRLFAGVKFQKQAVPFISSGPNLDYTTVEIKNDYDMNNMTRLVNLNLKWIFDKYQYYIQLCKVPGIFKETFTPQAYIDEKKYKRDNSKKGIKKGDSMLKYKHKTIQEYKAELEETKKRHEKYKLKS